MYYNISRLYCRKKKNRITICDYTQNMRRHKLLYITFLYVFSENTCITFFIFFRLPRGRSVVSADTRMVHLLLFQLQVFLSVFLHWHFYEMKISVLYRLDFNEFNEHDERLPIGTITLKY